jgi:hypothetical protein
MKKQDGQVRSTGCFGREVAGAVGREWRTDSSKGTADSAGGFVAWSGVGRVRSSAARGGAFSLRSSCWTGIVCLAEWCGLKCCLSGGFYVARRGKEIIDREYGEK